MGDHAVIIFSESDNVATATRLIAKGETIADGVTVLEDIPYAFKVALVDMEAGEKIVKYGIPIGAAVQPIKAGSLVHIHNVHSLCDLRSAEFDTTNAAPCDMSYEWKGGPRYE